MSSAPAIRFENPKNAAIAAMSQMSFSLKPAARSAAISPSSAANPGSLTRDAKQSRREVRRAPVDRDLIREVRIFSEDAQSRAVRRHAILTRVLGRHGYDDRLTFGAGKAALALHEHVVVLHERAKVLRTFGVRPEHVRHESDSLEILRVDGGDIGGKLGFGRFTETRDALRVVLHPYVVRTRGAATLGGLGRAGGHRHRVSRHR